MNRIAHYFGQQQSDWPAVAGRGNALLIIPGCEGSEWMQPKATDARQVSAIIRRLADELSGRADENASLRRKVAELSHRVEQHEQLLAQIFSPIPSPQHGTFEKWLTTEGAEVYRGKHVAFVGGEGVVASSDSLDDLTESVRQIQPIQSVTFGFVPARVIQAC
jgi:hypothetical protein